MYILKLREKNKIIFEKEYKDFNSMMEKFNSIDWDSGKYLYTMYEEMPLNKIINTYTHESNDLSEALKVLKEVIKDLEKEGK